MIYDLKMPLPHNLGVSLSCSIVLSVMVLLWFTRVTVVLQILQTLCFPCVTAIDLSEVREIMAALRLTLVHTELTYHAAPKANSVKPCYLVVKVR